MKYLYSSMAVLALVALILAGINTHDNNVYMSGYNAHKNEVLQLDQANIESANQGSELMRISDARRQQKKFLSDKALAEHYAEVHSEVISNDMANPGKYPDHWQLSDDDYKLLIDAASGTRSGKQLDTSSGIGFDHTVFSCGDTEREAHKSFKKRINREFKAVQRKYERTPQPGGSGSTETAVT